MPTPAIGSLPVVASPRESRGRRAIDLAKRPIRSAWRQAVRARAVDRTESSEGRSCLVLAPHPDDETLGCGATIARKRANGVPVTVVIAADGRHSHRSAVVSPSELAELRAAEAVRACEALGVASCDVRQLGYEDTHLADHLEALVHDLIHVIQEVNPAEILVTSSNDWHPDHQALNRAARRAVAAGRPEATVAEYPIWWWADGPWTEASRRSLVDRAAHFVTAPFSVLRGERPWTVSAGRFLEEKREALGAYESQLTNLTGEPGWAVMDESLLAPFLRRQEVFFPVGPGRLVGGAGH